jgi:hypothetical protein
MTIIPETPLWSIFGDNRMPFFVLFGKIRAPDRHYYIAAMGIPIEGARKERGRRAMNH